MFKCHFDCFGIGLYGIGYFGLGYFGQGGEKTVFFDKKQTNMFFFSKNTVFFMFFMFFIFFLISTMNLVKNNA